jgi:hypothetical protein
MVERNGRGGRELVDHGVEGDILQVCGIAQPRVPRKGGVVQVREVGIVIV